MLFLIVKGNPVTAMSACHERGITEGNVRAVSSPTNNNWNETYIENVPSGFFSAIVSWFTEESPVTESGEFPEGTLLFYNHSKE